MSTVDDDIRAALEVGIPETPPMQPASLADGLRVRADRRRRSRRLARVVGVAGALVVVMVLVSTVVPRDESTVQVVADGSDAATPPDANLRPLASEPTLSGANMLAPDLDRSLAGAGDDLIFVGEVRAVGEERAVVHTVPTGPNADIPMPTFDYSPVEVEVAEYLRVEYGVSAPDPIRLRMIAMMPFDGLVGSGSTPPGGRPPLTELLPVGSHVLVFASAPVDTGDGLAATPSTVFPVTDEGVIDEHGTVVPMDVIRARLAASSASAGPGTTVTPETAPDDIPATELGPVERAVDGRVLITVAASHCEPLTTGEVSFRVWADQATSPAPASGDDPTAPAGPGWRVLFQSVAVVDIVEERPVGSDGAAARSLIRVEAPPQAAQWLATYFGNGDVLWASPTRDSNTSCPGAPSPTVPG